MAPPDADLFLHLLAGLPEEEVRRDGRAQKRDEDADVPGVEPDRRDQRSGQDAPDVGPCEQGGADVGKKGQGKPLEDPLDEAIGAEDLEPDDPQADGHDEDDRRDRHEQVDGRRDGSDVRPGVQRVGDHQGDHGRIEGAGVVLPEHARQAPSAHQADLGAHVLDGRHHRQHRERQPERREAVLRSGLGVGPDARGIVVRCAGDEARTEDLAEAFQRVLLGPQFGCLRVDRPPGVHSRLAGPGRCVLSPHVRPAAAPATPSADHTVPGPPPADPRPAEGSPGTG